MVLRHFYLLLRPAGTFFLLILHATWVFVNTADLELRLRPLRYTYLFKLMISAVKPLLDNKELKPFTFLCMKAVNTPVNAIGRTTASHLVKDQL